MGFIKKNIVTGFLTSYIIFAVFLTVSGSAHLFSKPAVHWQERTAIVFIRNEQTDEILKKYDARRKDFFQVHSNGKGNFFKIPLEIFNLMDKNERTLINSPPFSWVEPDIYARRNSENINELMNGYKDEIIAEKILHHLASRYPEYTKLEIIGKSLQGRPIYALRISKNPGIREDEPAFLFSSALHGNEPLSIDYTLDMAAHVLSNTITKKNKTLLRAVNEAALWFVPVINPDGVNIFWNKNALEGRKNARDTTAPHGWNSGDGVDLNRNYPFFWNSGHREASSSNPASILYRGPHAGSEVEVRNMMNLALTEKFVMAFTFHTFATKILSPYTIEGADNPYPNVVPIIAETLAKRGKSFRREKEYIADKNLYPVDGTDQDWLFNALGTFGFTVEGSYQTPDYETARKSISGMRPISSEMLEVYFRGPTLAVHTVDGNGQPLSADVGLLEIANTTGETLQTEKKFGRFDFILPYAENYTIVAEKKGFHKSQKRIKCKKGVQNITIIMEPLERP